MKENGLVIVGVAVDTSRRLCECWLGNLLFAAKAVKEYFGARRNGQLRETSELLRFCEL